MRGPPGVDSFEAAAASAQLVQPVEQLAEEQHGLSPPTEKYLGKAVMRRNTKIVGVSRAVSRRSHVCRVVRDLGFQGRCLAVRRSAKRVLDIMDRLNAKMRMASVRIKKPSLP